MTYYVYLRTFYTPYEKVKDKNFYSLEEVHKYLDNVKDYEVYLIVGYEKDVPTYSDYGYIDRPKLLIKTPKKLF